MYYEHPHPFNGETFKTLNKNDMIMKAEGNDKFDVYLTCRINYVYREDLKCREPFLGFEVGVTNKVKNLGHIKSFTSDDFRAAMSYYEDVVRLLI